MSSTRRGDVLASILGWAGACKDVAAVIQTGSLARGDGSADALSDIDLEIIAHDPRVLAEDDRWLSTIADLVTVLHLEQDDGWRTRLAIYDGGVDGSVKVDCTLAAPGAPARDDGMARPRAEPGAGRCLASRRTIAPMDRSCDMARPAADLRPLRCR